MTPTSLPRLHAVTDDRVIADRDVVARAEALARAGGASLAIQLRSRALEGRALLALAESLRTVTANAGSWLIVNGRADVAAAVGADAVLSGREGLPVADLRRAAPGMAYGRSVHGETEARAAADEGADYLVAGAVFATRSHPDAEPQGLSFVTSVAALRVPVIGIGGITPDNAGDVIGAGAYGVAAIRALWDAPDPAAAVAAFRCVGASVRRCVRINGDERTVTAATLADLLSELHLDPRGVVVEHNRRIVRREGLSTAHLEPGDTIELVHFVGGG